MASPALAGASTSLMQTAPVLAPGSFEAKIQTDIILSDGGGFNVSPHFRFGILEHYLDAEVYAGTGTIDFQFGALAKYNVLPDLDGQVGLSVLFGMSFLKDKVLAVSSNAFVTTFGFIASKQNTASFGSFTPYGIFQVEAYAKKDASLAPITLISGVKFDLTDIKWGFYSELGININDSVWTVSGGVSHKF